MTTKSEAAAIKAFARLAIAAGAEPSHVRAQLGPNARCHTSATRTGSIVQLAADAEAAASVIGLDCNLQCPAVSITTRELFAHPEFRNEFAAAMIQCGSAILDMSKARPPRQSCPRREPKPQSNQEILETFDHLAMQVRDHQEDIRIGIGKLNRLEKQVWESPNWHTRQALQTRLNKQKRELDERLDEHDAAVRHAYKSAQGFRWRNLTGPNSATRTRNAFLARVAASRDQALYDSSTIRAWTMAVQLQHSGGSRVL